MRFHPYAIDLARRLTALPVGRALELAAGNGIATAEAVRALPAAHLVATDLHQAMLDMAARRAGGPNVEFRTADTVEAAVRERFGTGEIRADMTALVVTAQ